MKLPYLEEIYDFETEDLRTLLQKLNLALLNTNVVPDGYESYERFEKKALKLRDNLELELEER
jgi:hypothetical protein